mgnify:FL=1
MIVLELIASVCAAVHFYNQPGGVAIEVRDILPNW